MQILTNYPMDTVFSGTIIELPERNSWTAYVGWDFDNDI